jgi:hypothetical protein
MARACEGASSREGRAEREPRKRTATAVSGREKRPSPHRARDEERSEADWKEAERAPQSVGEVSGVVRSWYIGKRKLSSASKKWQNCRKIPIGC